MDRILNKAEKNYILKKKLNNKIVYLRSKITSYDWKSKQDLNNTKKLLKALICEVKTISEYCVKPAPLYRISYYIQYDGAVYGPYANIVAAIRAKKNVPSPFKFYGFVSNESSEVQLF